LSSFLEWATENAEHEFLLFGNQHTEFRVTSERVDARIVHETSRLVWDQISLPRLLGKTGTEVFLSPYYKGPLRSPCPVVVTASDLIELRFPRRGIVRRRLLPLWMRMTLRSAAHVLTPSEYSRQDIAATLGVATSRITAVPLAVDDRFLRPPSAQETRGVRERYNLPDRYVLYVGRCSPHKNVATLVHAWSKLPVDFRRRYALVLAGDDVSRFRRAAGAYGVDAIIPGFVQDADLPGVYGGATALAFPSLYEGFGLPPLEAMSCGTPVIAANATSIPEVVGSAARLVDPLDAGAWTRALVDLLGNDEALRQLAAAGLARAALFTKERTAAVMLEVLAAAARNGRR
jgi:glycosyltransferase involved in cell wall biosynthesis